MVVARLLRGFPEALATATSQAPRLLEKAASSHLKEVPGAVQDLVEHVATTAPKVLVGLRTGLGDEAKLPPRSVEDVSARAEAVGAWLRSAGQSAVGSSLQSHVDAANDVFSALGMQVRIIPPSSPEAQAHVRVSNPLSQSTPGAAQRPAAADAAHKAMMSPRELVELMRDARSAGNLDGVEQYIDMLLEEKRLQYVKYLSARLQRKMYLDVARLVVFSFQRGLLQLDQASFLGHTLRVVPRPVLEGLANARHPSSRRRRRSSASEEQFRVVVDEMFDSGAVHMPFVPKAVQKSLYVNCLSLIFQLVEDILGGESDEVVCMGHRIRFRFEPVGKDVDRPSHGLPVRHCPINEDVLTELVDEILADSSVNIAWMPDAVESQLYKGVLRLLLRSVEETVGRLRVNVLGREIHMSMLSSLEASAAKRKYDGEYGAQEEAMMYTEEDDPLRTISSNELEERLRDLTEQRRVLRAIRELGSASFDLTADTPMLRCSSSQAAGDADSEAANVSGPGADVAASVDGGGSGSEEAHEFQRVAYTMKLARSLSVKCEVSADIEVPYSMIADVTTYPAWMPWCTSGGVPPAQDHAVVVPPMSPAAPGFHAETAGKEQLFKAEVGFGFETGTFLGTVGDTVRYTISARPPVQLSVDALASTSEEAVAESAEGSVGCSDASTGQAVSGRVVADAVNGFTYGERLIYDWRFHQIAPKKTKVELDMMFQAKSVLYMPIWDSMQNMIVTKMLSAFVARAERLQRESDAAATKR